MSTPAESNDDAGERRSKIKASRLEIEANKSQIETRRAQLDDIVAGLSTWEVRRLRDKLNSISTEKDICGDGNLPFEILLFVTQYLHLEDVMRARRVCRAWNAKFTSEEFCVDTIKLHFRSLWENSYASLDAGNQELAKTNPSKWLTGAAMDRIVMLHGQYHSMEVYWYNWDLDERFLTSPYRPSGPADPQYSTGKIAFRVDSRTLVVRILSAELSQVFRDVNREPIDKFLLSDEFLIGQKSNPLTLLAWRLADPQISNDTQGANDPYTIHLPSHFSNWSAYHDQVGIINSKTEIMIWKIGGPVKSIHILKIKETFKDFHPLSIVFHPDLAERFFLASHGTLEDDPEYVALRIAMHEFVNGELVEHDYHFDVHLEDPIGMLSHFSMVDTSTGFFYGAPLSKVTSETASHARFCKHTDQESMEVLGMIFDIYSKQFSSRSYHLPDLPGNETRTIRRSDGVEHSQAFFRQDQALVPVYRESYRIDDKPVSVDGMLLMAINDCNHQSESTSPEKIPWYGQGGPEDTKPHFVSPSTEHRHCGMSYCWFQGVLARITGRSYVSDNDISGVIRGDDNFVVLFGDYGYYVWCLDRSVKLPTTGSRHDRWLSDDMMILKLPYPLKKKEH